MVCLSIRPVGRQISDYCIDLLAELLINVINLLGELLVDSIDFSAETRLSLIKFLRERLVTFDH